MSIRFEDVGHRLKAFRVASGLRPEAIAARVGISRAALYRYERGAVAKIDTLERFGAVYDVSVPSLLGVGVEYVASFVAFLERLRQLEETAEDIVIFFGPVSYLLSSEHYDAALRVMLNESVPKDSEERHKALADIERIMDILNHRKTSYRARQPKVTMLLATAEIIRVLQDGFVGNATLSGDERIRRRRQAADEVRHIASLLEEPSNGLQTGVIVDTAPSMNFQLFRKNGNATLTLSPFRLGAHPNVRVGVAMITKAPEAISLHERVAADLWKRALKGQEAATRIRALIDEYGPQD